MTLEEILLDLKSDRVKKVIFDGDMYAEVDDQYALAYCLGSDKIEVLSVSTEHFVDEARFTVLKDSMEMGYKEIFRVYDALGIDPEKCPAYKGADNSISNDPNFAPQDSPAARNIINTVKNSDEIIYVLSTGPCTAVVSACMIDPSITKNLCVLWLGCHCIDIPNCYVSECNLNSDYAAGQLLLNLDIPLVLLPCHGRGSINVYMEYEDFMRIEGDTPGAKLFREIYPRQCEKEEDKLRAIRKIMCDLVAPATLALNDSMSYRIITAPVVTDNNRYAWDSTRRKIIYMEDPDCRRIVDDAIKAINNAVKA